MVENGLRGGVSYIANRYSKPNNKYLSDYDKNKDSSYLIYLDANALYAWAMSLLLPTSVFQWLKEDKWDWLVVLRLNVPVNNFSVMSGRSHRFLGN